MAKRYGLEMPSNIPEDEEPKLAPCSPHFEDYEKIIYDYDDKFVRLVIDHGRRGLLIEGFSGVHNIDPDTLCGWLSEHDTKQSKPEFISAVKLSIFACIHFWNEQYNYALYNDDFDRLPHIRATLDSQMKCTPKALRENIFNKLQSKSADEVKSENKARSNESLKNLITSGEDDE